MYEKMTEKVKAKGSGSALMYTVILVDKWHEVLSIVCRSWS